MMGIFWTIRTHTAVDEFRLNYATTLMDKAQLEEGGGKGNQS
jgi:hypothetical protein